MLKFSRRNKKLVIPVGINPNYNIEVKDLYTTKDADVVAGDIIAGKIAYGSDGKIIGSLDLDNEKENSYNEGVADGYISGKAQGRIEGIEEGIVIQKDQLISIEITENGTYNREDGYNEVVVNVPDLNGSYDEGYEDGYSEGKTQGVVEGVVTGRNEIIEEQSDANIISSDIIEGKIGYSNNNQKVIGTLQIEKDKSKVSFEELERLANKWSMEQNYSSTPINCGSNDVIILGKYSDKLYFEGESGEGVNSFTYDVDNACWKYVYDVYGNEWKQPSNHHYDMFSKNINIFFSQYGNDDDRNYVNYVGKLATNRWGYSSCYFKDIEDIYSMDKQQICYVTNRVEFFDGAENRQYPTNLVTQSPETCYAYPIIESNRQGFQRSEGYTGFLNLDDFILLYFPTNWLTTSYQMNDSMINVSDRFKISSYYANNDINITYRSNDDVFKFNVPYYFNNINLTIANDVNYYFQINLFKYCRNIKGLHFKSIKSNNSKDKTLPFRELFYGLSNLEYVRIDEIDKINYDGQSLKNMFYNCTSLKESPKLDCSNVTDATDMFYRCTSLTDIGELTNLGKSLGVIRRIISLSYSPIKRESMVRFFNGLYNMTDNLTNRIYLSATTKKELTDEDIAIATSKGWTIS